MPSTAKEQPSQQVEDELSAAIASNKSAIAQKSYSSWWLRAGSSSVKETKALVVFYRYSLFVIVVVVDLERFGL